MNSSAVTIRRARPSDAEAIARLATQLGYNAESSAVADRLSRVLARSDQEFLVADHKERPVGWIHVLVSEYVEADAFVVIGGLVVDREYRNQGIGRRLLTTAEEWAVQHGCSVVRLSSSVQRTEAHAFYEGAGYTKLKTQYSFAKAVGAVDPEALQAFVPNVRH
jgi:ribosomal protein S18 acetylase RimI-like enzyme